MVFSTFAQMFFTGFFYGSFLRVFFTGRLENRPDAMKRAHATARPIARQASCATPSTI
jgi:hypothetical protein